MVGRSQQHERNNSFVCYFQQKDSEDKRMFKERSNWNIIEEHKTDILYPEAENWGKQSDQCKDRIMNHFKSQHWTKSSKSEKMAERLILRRMSK